MQKLRSAALWMACISVFGAATGALFIWLALGLPAQPQPPGTPPRFSAAIESAPSWEALKQTCTRLATFEDQRSKYMTVAVESNKSLFHVVMFGSTAWGLLTAAGFFYLYLLGQKAN